MSPQENLFAAIQSGDAASVASLLDAEPALANSSNGQGVPAHSYAIYNRKPEIAALLEQRGARIDVFAASMTGRADLLREQLDANKSLVKLRSHDGWTPLHLAAFFGHLEAARALLGAGASVTERSANPMNNMPLHAAAAGRHFDMVKLLVEYGAPVNAVQHGGWSALHAAAQNGDAAMAEFLLANGAAPQLRADNQQLPMDLALSKGSQAVVDLLEKHGANQ